MRRYWLLIWLIPLLAMSQENIYEVEVLPFCSFQYDEIAPSIYGNGLVYSANLSERILVNYKTEKNTGFFNLYSAHKTTDGKWTEGKPFSSTLRTFYHDGPITFTADGKGAFLTRNMETPALRIGNSLKNNNKLGIFYTEFDGKDWSEPVSLPINNVAFNTCHASISADGATLYFSSDRPGGQGRMDLYYSKKLNGEWQEPINLGNLINTAGDEIYPFYHSSGKLYFTSNRHNGKGRLDIFYSVEGEEGFTHPINAGEPINTKYDDFAYVSVEDNFSGYFSSNRRKKKDDIYSFRFLMPNFQSCDTVKIPKYCVTFFEEGAAEIDTVAMLYEWDLGDGTKIQATEAKYCYKSIGTYTVMLNVIDPITKEQFYNEATFEYTVEEPQQPLIISPEQIRPNQLTWYEANSKNIPNFKVENIYWVFDDDILSGSKINYTFRRSGSHRIQLGLTGKNSITGEYEEHCTYKIVNVTNKKGN